MKDSLEDSWESPKIILTTIIDNRQAGIPEAGLVWILDIVVGLVFAGFSIIFTIWLIDLFSLLFFTVKIVYIFLKILYIDIILEPADPSWLLSYSFYFNNCLNLCVFLNLRSTSCKYSFATSFVTVNFSVNLV